MVGRRTIEPFHDLLWIHFFLLRYRVGEAELDLPFAILADREIAAFILAPGVFEGIVQEDPDQFINQGSTSEHRQIAGDVGGELDAFFLE